MKLSYNLGGKKKKKIKVGKANKTAEEKHERSGENYNFQERGGGK